MARLACIWSLLWGMIIFAVAAVSTSAAAPPIPFTTPICRYASQPCVRLVDRNQSNITQVTLPSTASGISLPTRYIDYTSLRPDTSLAASATCPTNYSSCVETSAYVPTAAALGNGLFNITFVPFEVDVSSPDVAFLLLNLSTSVLTHAPPCVYPAFCNDTVWAVAAAKAPISLVVSAVTGLLDVHVVLKSSASHFFLVSSMRLSDVAIRPAGNHRFAPTISFESDPVRMRLSFHLPRGVANTTVCVTLQSSLCGPVSSLVSFQALANTTLDVLQGSGSVRANLTAASPSSLCVFVHWDLSSDIPHAPLGLALAGVSLSTTTPAFLAWNATGTAPQCAPVVFLASPRAIDRNPMVPKPLWTVVSLVLYVFALVVACLLVRLHGLAFVRETMYTDLALLSILCLLVASVLLHVLWLTLLNRLPASDAVETSFLVAVLDMLRQAVVWTLVVSISVHWLSIVSPMTPSGRLLALWLTLMLVYVILLVVYLVQNYAVIKCTYVDYLRNHHDDSLWLPLLQPAGWKYGADKVCVDSQHGFVYTYGLMHILPVGLVLVLATLGLGLVRQSRQSRRRRPAAAAVVHQAVLGLAAVVLSMATALGAQHVLAVVLYVTERHVSPLLWLVVGDYLPTLVPSLGFLMLQWNAKVFALPPPPSSSSTTTTLWPKQTDDDAHHALLSHPSTCHLLSQRMAELTVTMPPDTSSSLVVTVYQSVTTQDETNLSMERRTGMTVTTVTTTKVPTWILVATIDRPTPSKATSIQVPWLPQSHLRLVVQDGDAKQLDNDENDDDAGVSMAALLHDGHRVRCRVGNTTHAMTVLLALGLSSSISRPLDCDIAIVETLRESPWPTDVVLAYLDHLVTARTALATDAARDLAMFDAAQASAGTCYANIIDQIQGEADVDLVRQWLVQRIAKRREYVALLVECIALYKDRRRHGLFFKRSAEKKDSRLRFLPINLHLHDMAVETTTTYSTITMGAFACHTTTKFSHHALDTHHPRHGSRDDTTTADETDDDETTFIAPIPNERSFTDELDRFHDEVTWASLVRHDECNAHAVAALVTSAIDWVNNAVRAGTLADVWGGWVACGFLFHVESLVSDHGKESQVLADCAAAVDWLGATTLDLAFDDACQCVHPASGVSRMRLHPRASTHHHAAGVHVVLHLCCAAAWDALPPPQVLVVPLLFTQGINEMQTLANKAVTSYKETLPESINEANGARLAAFVDQRLDWPHMDEIQSKLVQLQQAITHARRERVKKKHPEILQLAGQITRLVGGARVTCCKDGINRTAMSVTLEHGWLLGHLHHVGAPAVRRAVATMRSEGVCLDIVEKNTGMREYSFTGLQRSMLPEAYRCPEGTYGAGPLV
ncbi:Aste57867_16857 [Aphanomyces stellatus]|uniref:Aste57867_16857 protein n=1 Tax=Aphanomyces stellatus TaxID=120398 RepID=A0A485L8B0_9STRA|nr:hypothetical protein As57867_016799 [Aphanomyces stellatus]VFT93621.1 Aste57867_16857 [Aphanomyces stellatus]